MKIFLIVSIFMFMVGRVECFSDELDTFSYAQYIICNEQNLANQFSEYLESQGDFSQTYKNWLNCTKTSYDEEYSLMTEECYLFRSFYPRDYMNDTVPESANNTLVYQSFDSALALECFDSCQRVVNSTRSKFFKQFINATQYSCAATGLPPSTDILIEVAPEDKNNYTISSLKQLNNCSLYHNCSCEKYFEGDDLVVQACLQQETQYNASLLSGDYLLCKKSYQVQQMIFSSQPLNFNYLACVESQQPNPNYVFYQVWSCKYQQCSVFKYFPFGPIQPDTPTSSTLLTLNNLILMITLILINI